MEVIIRETIKPSPSTPPHLRIYPLSFIDHHSIDNYVPLVFFYDGNHIPTTVKVCEERSKMLRKSLSEVLAMYYPFAGRLKDQVSIECNDEGVPFLVTHIKRKLSEILQDPKEDFLKPLFPDELHWKKLGPHGSIVAVQINHFDCGGMAITVCMSHKVGDATTLSNFIKDWASIATNSQIIFPLLNGASVFPSDDLSVFPETVDHNNNTAVCKRFVFEASKIRSLKAMVSQRVENPTRVQVVAALIYKCAVSALRLSSKCPNQLTTLLDIPVNLRARMVPPLPDKSVGNMAWGFKVSITTEDEELHELVRKIQQGLSEFCDTYAKGLGRKDTRIILEHLKGADYVGPYENLVLFLVTSWCRRAMYEVDFGWGKPIWVTTCRCLGKNNAILMDEKDGDGIEALVTMEEQEMALFESNVELLQYASLDPSVGIPLPSSGHSCLKV